MPREQFQADLDRLQDGFLEMGAMVDRQIERAVQALVDRDPALADAVVRDDSEVNRKRFGLDNEAMQLLAQQAPMARDLRVVISVLSMIVDLERMGDEAEKIGRTAMRLAGNSPGRMRYAGVRNLGRHVQQLARQALDAFARLDVEAAVAIAREDKTVDLEYAACMRELVTYMMEDPRRISEVLDVIWCARALERIADHAKNIGEYIVFLVKGKDVRHMSLEHKELQAQSEV